jgi:hypothetical protein
MFLLSCISILQLIIIKVDNIKIKGVPILTDDRKHPHTNGRLTIDNLSQALFIVNRHAKTAPNPKFLYKLKHESLKKLIEEGKAIKIGLNF